MNANNRKNQPSDHHNDALSLLDARIVYVATMEEAAHEGMDLGFDQGYGAALLVVEAIAKHHGDPTVEQVAGILLQAIERSREKAKEIFCSSDKDSIVIERIPEPNGTAH